MYAADNSNIHIQEMRIADVKEYALSYQIPIKERMKRMADWKQILQGRTEMSDLYFIVRRNKDQQIIASIRLYFTDEWKTEADMIIEMPRKSFVNKEIGKEIVEVMIKLCKDTYIVDYLGLPIRDPSTKRPTIQKIEINPGKGKA